MDAGCCNDREPVILPFGGHLALDTIPEALFSDFEGGSDEGGISGCRAKISGRAGIPRTCLVCGETAPSGSSFFANHLNAAYECPGGSDEGTGNADGSDDDDGAAVGSHDGADNAASSVSAPAPDLPSPLEGSVARVLASGCASISAPDLSGLLTAVLARLIALEPPVASLPPQPAVDAQALGAGAAGATAPCEASEAATPSAAPAPPPP